MVDTFTFKVIESTPRRPSSKTVEIESYWEAIKPNPDLLEIEEPEPPRKYKARCPPDRALVVIHEGRSDVLAHIGSSLDYLSEDCLLIDEIEACCEGMASGVYIWEGRMISTGPDYNGDYDSYLNGDLRPATKEEWAAHLDGEYIWDESLWYESDTITDVP
jgi:hypothetical protein